MRERDGSGHHILPPLKADRPGGCDWGKEKTEKIEKEEGKNTHRAHTTTRVAGGTVWCVSAVLTLLVTWLGARRRRGSARAGDVVRRAPATRLGARRCVGCAAALAAA